MKESDLIMSNVMQTVNESIDTTANSPVQISVDQSSNALHIANYDELCSQIDNVREMVEAYSFVDDDDRKLAKKARAAAVKWSSSVKAAVKASVQSYTNEINAEARSLNERADVVRELLDTETKRFDDEFRANRKAEIERDYKMLVESYEETLGEGTLDNDDVYGNLFNSTWLNRSVAHVAIYEAMRDRVESVVELARDKALNINTIEAAQLLSNADWSFRDARKAKVEQLEAAAALEAAEQELERLNELAAQEQADEPEATEQLVANEHRRVLVQIELPASDLPLLNSIAAKQNWHVSV